MAGIESDESTPAGHASHISDNEHEFQQYAKATYFLLIVMAIGTVASKLLSLTGITFPTYFGALIVAALVRSSAEMLHMGDKLEMDKIVSVGNICLSMFLGMAMISLKLWELEQLAAPLLIILTTQVIVMALLAWCGFGLGATPNAMANMSAVCYKYHYTLKPFLIVPIVGAMFVDLINTGCITMFLNWIS